MNTTTINTASSSASGRRTSITTLLRKMTWHLIELHRVRAERIQLAGLSDEMLMDIGVDRQTAQQESARKFLDLPSNRSAA